MKPFSSVPGRIILLLSTVAVGACAGLPGAGPAVEAPREGRVIDSETILASGARTAWDALGRTAGLHLEETSTGEPAQIIHRGPKSFHGSQTPLVVVDGTPLSDLRELSLMDARDLHSIWIRSASSASTDYGSRALNGVIELTTQRPGR